MILNLDLTWYEQMPSRAQRVVNCKDCFEETGHVFSSVLLLTP